MSHKVDRRAAALLFAVACSDSTGASKALDWSGAVIKVAAENPNAKGELRGVVVALDSSQTLSNAIPIQVQRWCHLKVTVQPATPSDTAWTTVRKSVSGDGCGQPLRADLDSDDYYVEASPPANEPFYSSATQAFASIRGAPVKTR